MITDENKKLAQWAMDYALKNGCQAAKVLLYLSLIHISEPTRPY